MSWWVPKPTKYFNAWTTLAAIRESRSLQTGSLTIRPDVVNVEGRGVPYLPPLLAGTGPRVGLKLLLSNKGEFWKERADPKDGERQPF